MTGAMPITSMSCAISRTDPRSSETSRTIARAITIPEQPPSAWNSRATVSVCTSGASAQAAAAMV